MWTVYLSNNQIINQTQCNWKILPQIPIIKIHYLLPNKKILILQGFKKYLYIEEYYQFIYGKKGKLLDTINLLGQYKTGNYQFSLNIRQSKALQIKNTGSNDFSPLKWNTQLNTFEFGHPQKTNINLWHQGVQLKKARVSIIK